MRFSTAVSCVLLLACASSAFFTAAAESSVAPAACVVEVSPQTLGGVFAPAADPSLTKEASSDDDDAPQQQQQSANRVPDAVRGLVDLKVSVLATPESSQEDETVVPAGWKLVVSLPESASVVFATNMELVAESSPPLPGSRSPRTYEGAATERAVEEAAAGASKGGGASTEKEAAAAADADAAADAPRTATFVAPAEWQSLRPGAQPVNVAYQVEARSASFEPAEVSVNGVKCAVVRPGGAGGVAAAAGARVVAPEVVVPEADGGDPSSSSSSLPPLAVSASDRPVSTNGSQLIGVDGKPFTIVGVNYFGFENGQTMVDGLWAQTGDATVSDFATVVWRLRLLGFNSVRLPFSFQEFSKTPRSFVWDWCANDTSKVISSVVPAGKTLPAGATPPPLDVTPTRTSMTCNDYVPATSVKARLLWASKFFAANGFYVVLDDHMIYDTLVLDDPVAWTKAWGSLAADVAADPILKNRVMFDLLNEPDSRGITWRSGPGKGGYGMDALYEMAGDAVYAANPAALMLFEGTGQLGKVAMNWGDGFATDPVVVAAGGVQSAQPFFNMVLSKPWASNVLISPHLYPPSVSTHREVDQVTGPGLFARLSNSFGYLTKKGVCSTTSSTPKCKTFPVVFGETGSKFTDSLDLAMLEDFAKYMRSEDGMHYPIPNMFWWSWNANSGDTGGIVGDDWRTVWWNKIDWLERASALLPWWRVATGGGGSSPSPAPTPTPTVVPTPPATTAPPATTKPATPPPTTTPPKTTPSATTKPATPPPTTTPPKTTVPPSTPKPTAAPVTPAPTPPSSNSSSFSCAATVSASSWQSNSLYYASLNIALASPRAQAVPYPVSLRIASAITVDSAWNWSPAKLPTAGWVTGKVSESWQAMGVGKPASLGLIVAGSAADLKPTAVSVSGTLCSVTYA